MTIKTQMTKSRPEYKEFKIAPDPYLDDPEIYSPAVQEKLEKLKKFFDECGIDYGKSEPDDMPKLKLKAYPNFDEYQYIEPMRDVKKWIDAVKDIYYRERTGTDKRSAISITIGKWDDMEKKDFFNWLKFYEEGAHLKYKYAQQMWYQGINPGYVLPFKQDTPPGDANHAEDSLDEMSATEKKRIIEQQRKKIIGRLDSIEKLLRSDDGQLFAAKEFETLLEIIYQLKKKIQLINKKSASTKLYEDMIFKEANVLMRKGFTKAADVLYKLAQPLPPATPPAEPTAVTGVPNTVPGAQVGGNKSDGVGGGATPPNNSPPNPESPPDENAPPPPPAPSEGMGEFLKGLEGGNVTSDTNDLLEVEDSEDCLEVEDVTVKEAQAAPPPPEPTPEPAAPAPAPEENLEVTEDTPAPEAPAGDLEVKDESPEGAPSGETTAFDSAIDTAFKNIKVDDIVGKLEDLAKIFKTREVPRQLAFVDMMLDTLGISSFFPSLAEATNKSLESNQYILTRVEDILSKLRGTMKTNEIDLASESPASENPEVQSLKGRLSEQDESEKAKKKMRKDLEDKKLQDQSKEAPEVEIEEDLSQPTEVAPGAAPATPPAPAPVPPT